MTTSHRTQKLIGNGISLLIDLPVVAFVAGLRSPRKRPQFPRSIQPFALSKVTIVDVKSSALLTDQTEVERASRIEWDRFSGALCTGHINDGGPCAAVRFPA
jgi:hypothetical protein